MQNPRTRRRGVAENEHRQAISIGDGRGLGLDAVVLMALLAGRNTTKNQCEGRSWERVDRSDEVGV